MSEPLSFNAQDIELFEENQKLRARIAALEAENERLKGLLRKSCAMILDAAGACPMQHSWWNPKWDCADECEDIISTKKAAECWEVYFMEVSDE